MKLLTTNNPKTIKGADAGYITAILHLAPSDRASLPGRPLNVCPMASPACRAGCLFFAGRGVMRPVSKARVRKTRLFFEARKEFVNGLMDEISMYERRARRHGMRLAVRLNGLSDLPFETLAPEVFERSPEVQFYDYTKIPKRMQAFLDKQFPHNYHLTFSRSETNEDIALNVLRSGGNVAVLFRDAKRNGMPKAWKRFRVINGDENDLRFLDPTPRVVGLIPKGRARLDRTGFVVD